MLHHAWTDNMFVHDLLLFADLEIMFFASKRYQLVNYNARDYGLVIS